MRACSAVTVYFSSKQLMLFAFEVQGPYSRTSYDIS